MANVLAIAAERLEFQGPAHRCCYAPAAIEMNWTGAG